MNNRRFRVLSLLSAAIISLPACSCEKKECPSEVGEIMEIKKENNKSSEKEKITLPSGLSYQILEEGKEQRTPTNGRPVVVHYTGWLADENGKPNENKKFDSSIDRGQPFSFIIGVGQVIKGWDEGVMSMKVGEKRRLFIPADLGYGKRGAGAVIPPNATLVFDVELLDVK